MPGFHIRWVPDEERGRPRRYGHRLPRGADAAACALWRLKVIAPEVSARSAVLRARFEREAELGGVGSSIPTSCRCMRWASTTGSCSSPCASSTARTSLTVLRRRGPLSRRPARWRIIERVATALAAAHPTGLVHRTKPANILSASQGPRARYLTDFGLARRSPTRGLGHRPVRRHASYSAPEQVRRPALDARTDVFALGGLLFDRWADPHPDLLLVTVALGPRQGQRKAGAEHGVR